MWAPVICWALRCSADRADEAYGTRQPLNVTARPRRAIAKQIAHHQAYKGP